ncbi:thioredoxin family protein [Acidisphaera sp. L21]|jgi:thioredoxin 1|uniref:thioredoxin family protein n=1 Tax=Acidisphaera sp. L21 TaxID=1641851 RepID=UPI00131AADC0|nr:thioredoxin family protein [Acidisphaera sp. L21]
MRLTIVTAAIVAGLMSVGTARAATEMPYSDAALAAAQKAGKPILIDITAPWCPTCAKQHPILSQLYTTPEFKDLQVFDVDFDTSKPLLRKLGVQMQSTMIVYHGEKEAGRETGQTAAPAIHALLAKANS